MAERFDVIIVGGGHNGLVAAAYLAAAGRSVLVVERRPLLGGACVTEPIGPGYRCSTTSYVCSLLRPEIIRELDLASHGFELLPCETSFIPFSDGGHLLLGLGEEEDARQIARFSARDAAAYPRFEAALGRLADFLRPTLAMTPPDLAAPRPADLWKLLKLGGRLLGLSRADRALLVKVMSMSIADLLDEWFESPRLKAMLAATGTIGIYGSPRTPGTAFVLLHHGLGEAAGEAGAWAFVRGGMGAISEALASAARSRGATLHTDAPVKRILVERGSAVGVLLESGEEIRARVVASNADPRRTFLGLVEPSELPRDFLASMQGFRSRGNSGKVHLALSELPDFSALPGDGPHLRGTLQIAGDDLEYLEAAFRDYEVGRPSERPYLEITIPSTVDDTLCPPGHHVMSISVKYLPLHLAEGDWESRREELALRVIETLGAHAPNLPSAVLHRHVVTPSDLESVYGLSGGNVFHGDMATDQLFSMRPLFGWAGYRSPVRNLYLCGAGSHPGGGVMGAAGRNAAREIQRDLRKTRLRSAP